MNARRAAARLVLVFLAASLVIPLAAATAAYPCDPPNLLPRSVCGMDDFTGAPPRQLPVGWTAFVLSGDGR